MTVSGNYPTPVYVNGYQCHNCAEVAEAKKDINPADPKAGPGGIDANTPANQAAQLASGNVSVSSQSPAVIFGGLLANNGVSSSFGQSQPPSATSGPGGLLNVSV